MKVALLSHSWLQKYDVAEMGEIAPRISIGSMAAYLAERGVPVRVIQNKGLKSVLQQIQDFQPDVLGLPAFTVEVQDAAGIAAEVKSRSPNVITVVGGCHPSAMPIETLQEFPSFDIVVRGEGEITLAEIASGRTPSEILGIAYREGDMIVLNSERPRIEDLDALPFPRWDLFDLSEYRRYNRGRLQFYVETGRGCPYGCKFCFRVVGRRMVYRSPSRIVDEIEYMVAKYKPDLITLNEGILGSNKKLALELCDELIKRNVDVSMEGESRANMLQDRELVERMKAARILDTNFGIESGNEEILRLIAKGQTLEQITRAVEVCNSVGVKVAGFCILGHPFETKETMEDTIRFARKLSLSVINFAIMVPFPGTEVRTMAEKGTGGLKILSNDWRLYGKQVGNVLELEQLPQQLLRRYQTRAYLSWYLYRPSRALYFAKNFVNSRTVALLARRFLSLLRPRGARAR